MRTRIATVMLAVLAGLMLTNVGVQAQEAGEIEYGVFTGVGYTLDDSDSTATWKDRASVPMGAFVQFPGGLAISAVYTVPMVKPDDGNLLEEGVWTGGVGWRHSSGKWGAEGLATLVDGTDDEGEATGKRKIMPGVGFWYGRAAVRAVRPADAANWQVQVGVRLTRAR